MLSSLCIEDFHLMVVVVYKSAAMNHKLFTDNLKAYLLELLKSE